MKHKSRGSILVICSHSDDQIIGVGGAMAKYAKEGFDVFTIIMSFGEGVKPHMQRAIISKTRIKEAQRADKIIGGSGVMFLGLKEGNFEAEIEKKNLRDNLIRIIMKHDPVKIFTHAPDDAHPDHRATFRIVSDIHKKMKLKADLYTFEVWHILNIKRRNKPKLIIDTTSTFKTKLEAIKAFKSQINLSDFYNYLVINNFLYLMVLIKDMLNGISNNVKYAEVFYKVR